MISSKFDSCDWALLPFVIRNLFRLIDNFAILFMESENVIFGTL